MNIKTKTRLLVGSMFTCLFACLFGTITGTVAWYSYSTRVVVSYEGATVYEVNSVQIGLKTKADVTGLSHDVTGDDYAWAPLGENLTTDILQEYLEGQGYATTELKAITSGPYQTGDDLALTGSLMHGYTTNEDLALKEDYVVLPLVFRTPSSNGSEVSYKVDEKIYITDIASEAASAATGLPGDVNKAIRVLVDNGTLNEEGRSNRYIINPTAEHAGNTNCAGLLDLNNDGYYDIDSETSREIVYGQYDNLPDATLLSGTYEEVIVDENGSGNSTTLTTFTAKHKAGIEAYPDIRSTYTPKVQEYLSLEDIEPDNDGWGVLTGGQAATVTGSNGIGELTLTIWLEGWDFAVIDQNLSVPFNIGFTFQISN